MNRFVFELNWDENVPGWEDQTLYRFEGPEYDNFGHELTVSIDRNLHSSLQDLEKYAGQRIPLVVGALKDTKVLKQKKVVLRNQYDAYELRVKHSITEEIRRVLQYFFMIDDNGRGLMFHCTYTKKSFKIIGPQVSQNIDRLLAPSRRSATPSRSW